MGSPVEQFLTEAIPFMHAAITLRHLPDWIQRTGATVFGLLLNDLDHIRRIRGVVHDGHTGLEDSAFVGGDLLDCVSEKLLVVETNFGDDGDGLVLQDIGRVVTAAHADFDDTDINLFLVEDFECRDGKQLERAGISVESAIAGEDAGLGVTEERLGNGLVVDCDAVPSGCG
jgi:hypothetical protein